MTLLRKSLESDNVMFVEGFTDPFKEENLLKKTFSNLNGHKLEE